ncbi:MAG: hypothetical protein CVV25_03940 [Ignavibacteriae bacterium HGW-Ignavibacteriae-4]|jgi:hypothetical protein|nr:MAG: hypothetical protein CVV25_03940 [Ignavibacteriae bacterium HGW-Ignavibacteriae-4]
MKKKHVFLVQLLLFIVSITVASSTEEQIVNEFKGKDDGVYFIISSYKCPPCLASIINSTTDELKRKNINYNTFLVVEKKFDYLKYKDLFKNKVEMMLNKDSSEVSSFYLIKKDGLLFKYNLHQLLDSRLIVKHAEAQLKIENIKLENDDNLIFSVNSLLRIDINNSIFFDGFNQKVYTYDNETNKVNEVDLKIDSLKNNYRRINKENLPQTWANGDIDTFDYYNSALNVLSQFYGINSFFIKNQNAYVILKLWSKIDYRYDEKSKNPKNPTLFETNIIFDLKKKEPLESELHYLQNIFPIDNSNFYYYSNHKDFVINQIENNKVIKEGINLNSYRKLIDLDNFIIAMNRGNTEIIDKRTFEIEEVDFFLNRSSQHIANSFLTDCVTEIKPKENEIILNNYNFNTEVTFDKLYINNNILNNDNYLSILRIDSDDKSTIIEILTEEQNIYKIKLSNN